MTRAFARRPSSIESAVVRLSLSSRIPGSQHPEYRVEHVVQACSKVRREKPEHEVTVRLQQRVLAAVPTIRLWVAEVLVAIDLDHQARLPAQKVNLHGSTIIEDDRQGLVEKKPPR